MFKSSWGLQNSAPLSYFGPKSASSMLQKCILGFGKTIWPRDSLANRLLASLTGYFPRLSSQVGVCDEAHAVRLSLPLMNMKYILRFIISVRNPVVLFDYSDVKYGQNAHDSPFIRLSNENISQNVAGSCQANVSTRLLSRSVVSIFAAVVSTVYKSVSR